MLVFENFLKPQPDLISLSRMLVKSMKSLHKKLIFPELVISSYQGEKIVSALKM